MNITQLSRWENLCRCHPTPWYMDKCNESGVEVKDANGDTVFYDDFGSIPDEMPTFREQIKTASVALALFLVAFSEPHN